MRPSVARVFAILTIFSAFGAQEARAQSVPDLVAKNLAARGGAAKLASIASLELVGKLVAPGGFELTYKETRARKDGRARFDSSVQGLTITQGFDGTTGWRINPFEGRRDAERLSSDATRELAESATIDGVLLSAQSKGRTVTYLGREDVDGTDAYKLRVVAPSGTQYVDYLDPDTYLDIKVVETRFVRGAKRVTLTEYADYELVDGAYFPFAIESGSADSTPDQRQKLTIETARANVDAPDALFAMPAAPISK